MAASRRAAFGFILASAFLEALAFGLILPIVPRLVEEVAGGGTGTAARWYGLMAGAWALANFFAAPVLGALSDRYGRRPVLLISAFGFGVDLVLMALAPNVAWLLVGRMISGVTAASGAAASAYVADITPAERRAARFGVFSAVASVGQILGPAAGGLLGQIGPRAPFWVAAAIAGAMAVYGLFVLPESLPAEKRAPLQLRNPFASFGILRSAGQLRLAVVFALLGLASSSVNAIFVLYLDHRYGWGVAQAGLLLTVFGAGMIVVMGVIAPWLVRRLGEWRAMITGLGLLVLAFVAMGLADTPLMFCLSCVPMCLGNLCFPALRAIQTNLVADTEQGRLQGALGGVGAVTSLVGPIAFTQVFAYAISRPGDPGGASLFMGAALLVLALAVAFVVPRAAKPAVKPA